jgi:hypothetical protein
LPAITTIGANTAGCIVDGKVLIPKNASVGFGTPPVYGLFTGVGIDFYEPIIGDDYKYIKITNYRDVDGDQIYIHLNDMTQGLGIYEVNQSNGEYYILSPNNNHIVVKKNINKNNEKTYISTSNAGIVTLTRFDYYNGVYSGTFSCTLENISNPTEKIQVNQGRFDIKIATLNN